MARGPIIYNPPPGTIPQNPGDVIQSAVWNAFVQDVTLTFNTIQPKEYGGTGSSDLKLDDADFGIKNNADNTKIGKFSAANLPTATTRTYDLPYFSGTLGLVSDIRGKIYGLTLSNNATDTVNDIDIASGAAVDASGAVSMVLGAALGKRLDAAWAVGGTPGASVGGLDTGSIANTTYHIYLIRRPDTGVVDACFSASSAAPTIGGAIPAAYTQYRRIGAIIRGAGVIWQFTQRGNYFILSSPANNANATNPGTSAVLRAMTVPNGVNPIRAIGTASIASTTPSANYALYVSSPLRTDITPDVVVNFTTVLTTLPTAGSYRSSGYFEEYVNTSGEVRTRLDVSDGGTAVRINTLGWYDARGQDA